MNSDVSEQGAKKPSCLTPAKAEEKASAKRATSPTATTAKRKLIIDGEEEKVPEQNDDMNNAIGGLGSSASPSSGSGEGTSTAPVAGGSGSGGGTSPSSVSTAAAVAVVVTPPAKKMCINTDTAVKTAADAETPVTVPTAASAVPPQTAPAPPPPQPTAKGAVFPPTLLPFLPFTGLANSTAGVFPFSFAAWKQQQQQPLQQQQQQQVSTPLPLSPPLPASATSPILELTPVQKAVLDHATATKQDPATVWTSARHIALKYTAQQLLKALAAPVQDVPSPSPSTLPAAAAKVTAGVSYVVRTESKQIEVSDQDILPHMVYRPPAPVPGSELSEATPAVAAALELLLKQTTLAVSMPLKDENAMKTYLLDHAERAEVIDAAGGAILELEGAGNVAPLCQDKSFICLHYNLVQEDTVESNGEKSNHMNLVPCLPSASSSSEPAPVDITGDEKTEDDGTKKTISSSIAAASLARSNVQLGIMIRKGVGGTYPLRSAARKLHTRGLLGALMDENLPTATTITAEDNAENTNSPENGTNAAEISVSEANEGPAPAHQRLSLYTLSCRLELYLDEETWETLNSHNRLVLQSTVYHLENRLRGHFEKRNWEMLRATVREKLETLVETTTKKIDLAGEEKDNDISNENLENEDVMDSALTAKLLPLFSLPELALQQEQQQISAADEVAPAGPSSPVLGKDDLTMDFSLALVLSASCLSTESHALHHVRSSFFSFTNPNRCRSLTVFFLSFFYYADALAVVLHQHP